MSLYYIQSLVFIDLQHTHMHKHTAAYPFTARRINLTFEMTEHESKTFQYWMCWWSLSRGLIDFLPFTEKIQTEKMHSQEGMNSSPPVAPAWACSASRSRPGHWMLRSGWSSPLFGAPADGPCSKPPCRLTPAAASPPWSRHPLPLYAGYYKLDQTPGERENDILFLALEVDTFDYQLKTCQTRPTEVPSSFLRDGISVIDRCTVPIYLTQVFTVQGADLWWPKGQSLIVTIKACINSNAGTKSRASEITSKVQSIAGLNSRVQLLYLLFMAAFFFLPIPNIWLKRLSWQQLEIYGSQKPSSPCLIYREGVMWIGSNNNRSTSANKWNTFIERDLLSLTYCICILLLFFLLQKLCRSPRRPSAVEWFGSWASETKQLINSEHCDQISSHFVFRWEADKEVE